MSDDASPLPWTPQQWASLRAVVQESARKSRVASSFLPLDGPLPSDQTTVPSYWMKTPEIDECPQRGEAPQRLEVRSGKTLQLTTIACNVYLRGSEVADPELSAAKSMLRRAAEVLGRLEDAIVFNGLPKEEEGDIPRHNGKPVVSPVIYTVSGGRDLTGLLEAPDTLWASAYNRAAKTKEQAEKAQKKAGDYLAQHGLDQSATAAKAKADADLEVANDALRPLQTKQEDVHGEQDKVLSAPADNRKAEVDGLIKAIEADGGNIMCVHVGTDVDTSPIVSAIVKAVEKLEHAGHFGPFACVLGHRLYTDATTPNVKSLVLPSDRFTPFLDGGPLLRSSTLPDEDGVVVALAGSPVELVVGTDMNVQYLQTTLEPRHVLRVYERFVLRIKQLDAICRITKSGVCLTKGFEPKGSGA